MIAAEGILTSRGGLVSHAAVVARGMGKPAICGAEAVKIDLAGRTFVAGGVTVREGDVISINGTSGEIVVGEVPVITPEPSGPFGIILGWADQLRTMKVRTNADLPEDARKAREFGAEGIGLCRTEHMFLGDRLPIVQRMILADTPDDEASALEELRAQQETDFEGILEAMDGLLGACALDLGQRSRRHHFAAVNSRARAKIDNVICAPHRFFIVLDDD